MTVYLDDRTAKWLVGDALASTLVLRDGPLARQLAEQGHEVVVTGPAEIRTPHPEIGYVRAASGDFPFVDSSFSVVVLFDDPAPTLLAAIARVLEPGGLVSTYTDGFDETVPWLRKLRDLVGGTTTAPPTDIAYGSTGLFDEPETEMFASWEQLGLDGLMEFTRTRLGVEPNEAQLTEARALFESYGAKFQPLRLRRYVRAIRARVIKEKLPPSKRPPDTTLLDFN